MIPPGGSYLIAYLVPDEVTFAAGTLPEATYPPGLYAYIGRASKNLAARLERQAGPVETVHWHIDYLKQWGGYAMAAWVAPNPEDECRIAQTLATRPGVTVPVPGFGAADCRSGCPAHLFHLGQQDWNHLITNLMLDFGGWRVRSMAIPLAHVGPRLR